MQITIKVKPVLTIVQFAQITQIDNVLQRVDLKRHFLILQIVLKLKLSLQIVRFAQITKIVNGTSTCRSEKTFLHFADCT